MPALRALLAVLLLGGGPALADIVSAKPDTVALTLYHDDGLATSDLLHPERSPWIRDEGLAFITETRVVDLPAGPSTIRLRGVASTIVPQTAVIEGLPTGVLEQNFDYDLLTPGSLLAKSIGKTVHLVRTDRKTGRRVEETAIVRSGPAGAMIEIDGGVEALHCGGWPEKLQFDEIPEGLADTPTLSLRTDAPAAGRYTIKLSYIATGLNWSADYVARIAPDGRTLDLSGWLTLANFGDTGFGRIPVDVVAGKLDVTGQDHPIHPSTLHESAECWPTDIDWATHLERLKELQREMAPPAPPPPPSAVGLYSSSPVTAVSQQEIKSTELGDYKLYALPEPTLVAARQTKQVQFLERRDVAFEKIYRGDIDLAAGRLPHRPVPASVVLRTRNDAERGLGKPLPAGTVTAMERGDAGAPILVGQASIRDTAIGLPIELKTGDAMDVQVDQYTIEHKAGGDSGNGHTNNTFEVDIENAKSVPIRFELRQVEGANDFRILSESMPHVMDRGAFVWKFALAPFEHATLRVAAEFVH